MTAINLDLSYRFSDKFDIWLAGGMAKKTVDLDLGAGIDANPEAEFKLTPISIDLRYFLFSNRSFDVFVGAGLSLYAFEETNFLYNINDNAVGFNVMGGAYYNITRKFGFQFILKYNNASKTIGTLEIEGEAVQATQDLKLSNLEVMVGLTYDF